MCRLAVNPNNINQSFNFLVCTESLHHLSLLAFSAVKDLYDCYTECMYIVKNLHVHETSMVADFGHFCH